MFGFAVVAVRGGLVIRTPEPDNTDAIHLLDSRVRIMPEGWLHVAGQGTVRFLNQKDRILLKGVEGKGCGRGASIGHSGKLRRDESQMKLRIHVVCRCHRHIDDMQNLSCFVCRVGSGVGVDQSGQFTELPLQASENQVFFNSCLRVPVPGFGTGGGCFGKQAVTKHRDGKKDRNLNYSKQVPCNGFPSGFH